ncbi:flagellar filament capping protein FliD [Vogesella sp. DC21W]|uniref:Flagellar hook-associated protein 2 n=1 Tax=Vogesella aquatica TaxID=2984206 RepID=A0ABT5IWC7_9NEIS|nr:flagellar filament capping protein FliD [Vogesella aquatica]MDC7716846.1 flagellar filament capping protein FliD [Vogesella aquatica]
MAAITTAGSNFDVQGLVSQLMSVEQAPLTSSKNRINTYNNQVSSLGKLKSALSDFQTSLRGLISGSSLNANKTDSSDASAVKANAGSTAASGTYVVNVSSLAAAQTLALTGYDGSSGKITSNTQSLGNATGGDLSIAFGSGTTLNVTIGANASLQSISDAINAKGGDVSASVVNSGTDGYKLALSSKKAGNDGAFSVTGGAALGVGFLDFDRSSSDAANLAKRTAAPSDAQFTVNGVAITASSNKITEALTGLELNLYKTGSATVTVTRDDDAVIKNVQSFVDGFNKIKSQIDGMYKQSSSQVTDANGKVVGTAVRLDSGARMIMQDLTAEMTVGLAGVSLESGLGYLSQAGISLQKDGNLKLDSEAFKKALNKDSTAVYKLFSNSNADGYADRLNGKLNKMLGPDGMVQVRTDSLNLQVTYEKQKQDQIQARLDMMQKRYLTQFSSLDAALAKMKNQSSYMASMLG